MALGAPRSRPYDSILGRPDRAPAQSVQPRGPGPGEALPGGPWGLQAARLGPQGYYRVPQVGTFVIWRWAPSSYKVEAWSSPGGGRKGGLEMDTINVDSSLVLLAVAMLLGVTLAAVLVIFVHKKTKKEV